MCTNFWQYICFRKPLPPKALSYPQPTCLLWTLGTMPLGSWVCSTLWNPLPPVVHQHKGDGHGQARSEQETVHAVKYSLSICSQVVYITGSLYIFVRLSQVKEMYTTITVVQTSPQAEYIERDMCSMNTPLAIAM